MLTNTSLNFSQTVLELNEAIAQLQAECGEDLRCSFCGKPAHEAGSLLTGHDGAHICDLCVEQAGFQLASKA
jgi:hypothetical protein